MKKLIFLALLCFTAGQVLSQLPTVKLRGDTIEILKNQGSAELAIRNSTRDTAGFLLNVGNGATQFHAPHRTNDSTIQIGPITIIIQAPGSTPGTNSGDTIYIAAAVDTFYTVPIGTAAGMIQTQYTISGPNFSEIRHSNWGPGLWTIPHLAADSLAYIDIDSAALRAYLEIAAGGVIITADNGLQKNTATNIQIGGGLLHNSEILTGVYQLDVRSSSNAPLVVTHVDAGSSNMVSTQILKRRGGSPATSYGESLDFDLQNSALDSMTAVSLQTSWVTATAGSEDANFRVQGYSNGVSAQNWMDVNGFGVISYGTSTGFVTTNGYEGVYAIGVGFGGTFIGGAVGAQIGNSADGTNTVEEILQLTRQGSVFNGAVGEGSYIGWDLHNSAGSSVNTGQIRHTLIDATLGFEKTDYEFFLDAANVRVFTMKGGSQPTYNVPLPVFASNALALAGGLVANDHYRNGDADMIVH